MPRKSAMSPVIRSIVITFPDEVTHILLKKGEKLANISDAQQKLRKIRQKYVNIVENSSKKTENCIIVMDTVGANIVQSENTIDKDESNLLNTTEMVTGNKPAHDDENLNDVFQEGDVQMVDKTADSFWLDFDDFFLNEELMFD